MADHEDEPTTLLPCAICARTFKPQSLEKHTKVCERAAIKKRKPFDSAKQRIRGTELEEFLPCQVKKLNYYEERINPKSSWKQTHDEFLRAIRAAREDSMEVTPNRSIAPTSNVSSGAPTRANEKGQCPTCYRQFGIKAYDRHVAWCKERITRAPSSPATNVAKERLDARMNYRAPGLKNRRMTNREKYAPGNFSMTNITNNIKNNSSPPSGGNKGMKDNSLPINGNKHMENPVIKPSAVAERRHAQGKIDGVIAPGPLKSRLSDRSINGMSQDYDPFLIAERQLNELLSDTCSDQSFPDSPSSQYKNSKSPHYPLSPSSAFVKYPNPLSLDTVTEKRVSLIAPPSEFDDLSMGFSSDSTETNSITRELYTELESSNCRRENNTNKNKDKQPILSRRLIIDKSKALGCTNDNLSVNLQCKNALKNKNHKALNKISSNKVIRPQFTRSNSVRAASASKNENGIDSCYLQKMNSRSSSGSRFLNKNNNYGQNSGSNLSLNSIISSENDTKQSNFGLDELINSFDDDTISYPSLKSFLKNDSLSTSSPIQVNRNGNGQVNDDELSSPDSYKRQDQSKISVDSAYSSLNRKYSNHGLISNDMTNKRNEITPSRRSADNDVTSTINKSKMSKFCHECGTKFPDTAKFCCECGVQRLAL
ncbi:hypothetical protein PV327_005450 [Microctonus hyperodae]|uniref:C2HC/C3H-type domain-containing protein n=1 Tax=Microctonus hyperodae TaxID=165561 RepID=A0AA39G1D4_MICHY|nr:hypothetical protein PV327_005450 [Microctonus hyperodae]